MASKLEKGQRVGPYQLLFMLGEGGMGQVWAASRGGGGGRAIALKLIRASDLDSGMAELFLDEARTATVLRHPHIVATFERGIEGDLMYIAMELVSGPSVSLLLKTLKKRDVPCPIEVMAHIAEGVAGALHYAFAEARAHGKRLALVHRDVSPHNILLDTDGRVFLSDFGVARTSIQEHHTIRGEIRGKPEYMSPEQVAEESLDHRSDIFSLGVVLHEMATLKRLFKRGSLMHSMMAVANEPAKPIRERRLDVPPDLAALMDGMLVKDREARVQSANEVMRRLAEIREANGWTDPQTRLAQLVGDLFREGEFDVDGRTQDEMTPASWPRSSSGGASGSAPSGSRSGPVRPARPESFTPASQTPSRPVERPLAPPSTPSWAPPAIAAGVVFLLAVALGFFYWTRSQQLAPKVEIIRTETPVVLAKPPEPPPPVVEPPEKKPSVPPVEMNRLARKAKPEEVAAALDRGGEVDTPDPLLGWAPIHAATHAGRTDVVELLLSRKAKVDQKTKDTGATALLLAAKYGQTDIARLLLSADADPNAADATGDAPLHAALSDPTLTDGKLVTLLLKGGADQEKSGAGGHTPLVRASIQNHLAGVKALLSAGAALEQRAAGATPLWHAAAHGRPAVVKLLLRKGAERTPHDDGTTLLAAAEASHHRDVIKLLK